MNSVFSKLKVNISLKDLAFRRYNTTLHLDDSASQLLFLVATVVLSATRMKLDRSDKDRRSFNYTRNNRGHNLLPWGTPIVMFFFNIDFTPFKDT